VFTEQGLPLLSEYFLKRKPETYEPSRAGVGQALPIDCPPSCSFIGASFTSEIWHLLLSQGVAFGIGMGFCFVGSVSVVAQWFTKRRSFANALAASGSGFGGLIYSLATNASM